MIHQKTSRNRIGRTTEDLGKPDNDKINKYEMMQPESCDSGCITVGFKLLVLDSNQEHCD